MIAPEGQALPTTGSAFHCQSAAAICEILGRLSLSTLACREEVGDSKVYHRSRKPASSVDDPLRFRCAPLPSLAVKLDGGISKALFNSFRSIDSPRLSWRLYFDDTSLLDRPLLSCAAIRSTRLG